ncbi:MAG: Hsp20/alpha crystallin family protein [Lachnospiraceae bacterium]|nr:Hsp20/alpha crystallin family protein [Lachnospiraceae bacterium]
MYMPTLFGENLFDEFFDSFQRPTKRRANAPLSGLMKTDVKEHDDAYELGIELPGYKKEDIKLELKDGYMNIRANNETEKEEKDEKGTYLRRERYVGSMSRSFYVGEALTEEDIKAKFEDGILKITVPKKEAKPAVEENHYIAIEG